MDPNESPPPLPALGNGRILELDREAGRAVLEFQARQEFCHSGGVVQGGFVTGWIDSAMAHAAMGALTAGEGRWFATLELKISFYRPAIPGTYTAEGWVEKSGRNVCFVAGRLLDEEGRVVATGTSTGTWSKMPEAESGAEDQDR